MEQQRRGEGGSAVRRSCSASARPSAKFDIRRADRSRVLYQYPQVRWQSSTISAGPIGVEYDIRRADQSRVQYQSSTHTIPISAGPIEVEYDVRRADRSQVRYPQIRMFRPGPDRICRCFAAICEPDLVCFEFNLHIGEPDLVRFAHRRIGFGSFQGLANRIRFAWAIPDPESVFIRFESECAFELAAWPAGRPV